MKPLSQLVRPNILALQPYSTARDEYAGGGIDVWLDANESPYDNGVNRYPDPHQRELKAQLAALKGVRSGLIFLGNGSDEAIALAFRIFCRPRLDNAVSLATTYEMYRVAKEFTRSSQLDRENQLLGMEARRYTELRTYMKNTRRLRHDFRQHLHVIAGLTEAGQLEEMKSYLHKYESELSEQRSALCANAAVDALAGHYDNEAKQQATPIEWKLELPRQLPLPEADLCTVLGNLLENALHASQRLPPEQRQVRVMARMLSPAMLGIVVENRYDGVLKKQLIGEGDTGDVETPVAMLETE